MSAFTGVDPSRHRVVANGEYAQRDGRYKTFVARLHEAGIRSSVATAWEEVTARIVEADVPAARHYGLDPFAARWLAGEIRAGESRAYFVHLNDPDAAGHATGFSADNATYVRAIEACDRNLGVVLDAVLSRPSAAREDWLFVLTTDHGGSGTTHGPIDLDNQRIWFVAAGASVRATTVPDGEASHMDLAPTALRWLGVTIDPAWGIQGVARAQ
jgi:arylsulfatase A-like enzyme